MMSQCIECFGEIDEDGYTTSECPISPPSQCETCDACYCDGSC